MAKRRKEDEESAKGGKGGSWDASVSEMLTIPDLAVEMYTTTDYSKFSSLLYVYMPFKGLQGASRGISVLRH